MVSPIREARRLPALAALATAVAVTAAFAQTPGVSLRLVPNVVGRASTLVIEAEGQGGQGDGRTPKSAVLSVQRGFRLDPRSRSARCSAKQAQSFDCPEASRVGSGQAVVSARG